MQNVKIDMVPDASLKQKRKLREGKLFKMLVCPYVIYAVVWTVVLLLYPLGWTYLYPKLTSSVAFFFFSTSFVSFIWGYSKVKRNKIKINTFVPDERFVRFIYKFSRWLILFLIIEFVSARSIPLLDYITGKASAGDYAEFGLPFVHVFVVTGLLFITIFTFHCYLSSGDKNIKKKLFKAFVMNIIALASFMSRGVLLYTFFGCLFIFFMVNRSVMKYFLKISLAVLVVFFGFGVLGNLRSGINIEAGEEYILTLGDATPKFRDSSVPAEFFWPYLYITSPISNVQNTINKKNIDYCSDNFISYVVNSLIPQTISKRLNVPKNDGELAADGLTVGSVYYGSYAQFGWWGMIMSFCFMFLFVEVNLSLVSAKSPFFPATLAIINIIIMFNVFDNMFVFSGLVPSLVYPIYFSYKRKLMST